MQIDVKQGSQEWLDIRKTKITGTDASIILGVNPFKNAYKLWAQKVGKLKDDFVNDKMLQGQKLEPEARAEYERSVKIMMMPSVHISDIYPWQMCSTDGISFDGDIILEIKCGRKALEDCQNDIIPPYYLAQMQHNLSVTGAKRCHYFCYFPMLGFSLKIVERDEGYIHEMIKKELEFYQLLTSETPPETTEDDFIIVDTPEFNKAAQQWKEANAKFKAAEFALAEAREELLDLTDDSNIKGGGLELKRISRTTIDYKKAVTDAKIDVKNYTKESIGYYKITEIK